MNDVETGARGAMTETAERRPWYVLAPNVAWVTPILGAWYFASTLRGARTATSEAFAFSLFVFFPALSWVALAAAVTRGDDPSDTVSDLVAGVAFTVTMLGVAALAFPGSADGLVAAVLLVTALLPWLTHRVSKLGSPVGRKPEEETPFLLMAAALLVAALVAVPFVSYGLVRPDGVHRMGMTDWMKHFVVTTSLEHDPRFPPANPFLAGRVAAPYYYGFHLLAAAIHGGSTSVDPFPVLLGLTLVTAGLVPLALFAVARGLGCERRVALVAALGGTFLGGFDLIPLALQSIGDVIHAWPLPHGFAGLRAIVPSTHVDSWIHHDERQFNAPYVAAIWAPQHVLGAVMALLAFHSARPCGEDEWPPSAAMRRVTAAVLCAALPSVSAYVAIGLAAGVVGAIVAETALTRIAVWRTAAFASWLRVAIVALLLALPALLVLRGAGGGGLALHVSSAGSWRNAAFFTSIFGDHPLTRLLDTPAVLLFELGLAGLLAAVEVPRAITTFHTSEANGSVVFHRVHAAGAIVAILLLTTFVRPPIGGPNNLYARPMLVVWGLLVPFAALAFERLRGSHRARRWIALGAVPCVLYLPYAIAGATLEGALFWAAPRELPEASRWIDEHTAPETLVAIDPAALDSSFGYWLRRRLVIGDRRHALLFGAAGADYDATARSVAATVASLTPTSACHHASPLPGPPRALVTRRGSAQVGGIAAVHWLGAPGAPSCFRLAYANERYEVWVNRAAAASP